MKRVMKYKTSTVLFKSFYVWRPKVVHYKSIYNYFLKIIATGIYFIFSLYKYGESEYWSCTFSCTSIYKSRHTVHKHHFLEYIENI